MNRHLALRLLLLGALAVAACSKAPPPAAPSAPKVVRISQRNEPADLDPAKATLPDEYFIIRALSEGLVKPAASAPRLASAAIENRESKIENQEPLPALATSWDISPNGLVYTFHLRPDAQWSNGDPVTANDFIFSYARLLAPTFGATKAAVFYPVRNAELYVRGEVTNFAAVGFAAPDPHTLVITLHDRCARFLQYVASGPWIPVHPATVKQYGREWTQPEHFVGNGPFTLAEWRQQQRIVVRKNPRYYGAAAVRLDELRFIRFDSGDTEERAYRAGEVDVTMDVPRTKIASYSTERPTELYRTPLYETRYLAVNQRREHAIDMPVAKLSLVLDRQQLIDRVLLGGQTVATSIIPQRNDYLLKIANPPAALRFDLDEAKREEKKLTAAELEALNKRFPTLSISPTATKSPPRGPPPIKRTGPPELSAWSQSQVTLLEAIQAAWKRELGFEVAINIREAKVHLAALASGDFDIALVTLIPDVADPAAILTQFTPDSPVNYTGWNSGDPRWRTVDFVGFATTAVIAPDPVKRLALEHDAEAILLRGGGIIPLYFNTKNFLIAPRVHGWREDALWQRDYTTLTVD